MKKLLTILLSLWALTSFGQVVESPIQFKLDGTTVTGKFMRDLAVYPYVTGFAAAKAAAESRTSRPFNVTITSGSRKDQILLATTTPPPSTTMATGVTWLTGLRYSLVNNLLTIEAAGEAVTLKFGRQDGQSMTGTNPDGAVLNTTKFFANGPLDNQGSYNKQWTGSFNPAVANVPLVVTFKRTSTGVIVAYNFTPVAGANRVQIIGGTTTSPPSSTTTAPPSTTAPTGNPVAIDNFDYTPYASTDPEADNGFPVFESSRLKIVLGTRNQTNATTAYGKMGLGGAIYNVYDKADPGFNWLVNPRYNRNQAESAAPYAEDYLIGPQNGLSMCLYQMPIPNAASDHGYVDRNNDPGLGYNPNEGGDDARFSGVRLAYGRQGNKWYVKTRPRLYEAKDIEATPVTYEKWSEVAGIALKQHYKINFNRTDQSGIHKVQTTLRDGPQEMPCYYVNSLEHSKIVWYDGSNPYGNDGVKEWKYTEGSPNAIRTQGLYLTEPLIAVCNDDKSRCTGLLLHNNMRSQIGKFGWGGNRDWISTSQGSIYIGDNPHLILDDQITVYKYSETLVGSWAEMRQYVYNHTYRPQAKPEFRFNKADRLGWTFNTGFPAINHPERHTWDDGVNSIQANGGWVVRFGPSNNANIISPAVAYKAADIQTIYVNMSYSGSSTEWMLNFRRNRQLRESANMSDEQLYQFDDAESRNMDNDAQKIRFSVQGNGSTQTYAIPVSTKSGWKNIITELHLRPHPNVGQNYGTGGYAKINWISTNPNGPN